MNKIRNNKAFTLIELIVVVGIIGILVGIASPRFTGYTEKAKVAKYTSNGKVLENSVEIFNIKNDRYPRLSETAYTADEVKGFAKVIKNLEGEEVTLDADGKYYDVDYLAINDSISIPDDEKARYILQNPKGKVYYLEDVNDEGLARDNFNTSNPKNNSSNKELDNSKVIKIESARQLSKIGKDARYPLDGKYIQTSDIDLSGFNDWEPIGNNSNPFEGEYDGGEYFIYNLNIENKRKHHTGFFGKAVNSKIDNVLLRDVSVSGETMTGGLVGRLERSVISNSSVSGDITSYSDNTESFGPSNHTANQTGGLVGIQKSSSINNSYFIGNVVGGKHDVGGLVGRQDDSKVESSYFKGKVKGSYNYTGGLVGRSSTSSSISNSYTVADINGGKTVGGLVGFNYQKSSINNSFSNSTVSGDSNLGGLVGISYDAISMHNSGWNIESYSGEGIGSGSGDIANTKGYKTSEIEEIIKNLIK